MKTLENRDGWSDQRVARLKSLWADGLTCSAIARDLGGITRNAVIGKVCRLGLPHRKVSDNSHKRPCPKQRRSPFKFNFASGRQTNEPVDPLPKEPFVYRETVVTPEHERRPFEALEQFDRKCRYAHGDKPPFMFCNEKAEMGLSWCRTHAKAVSPILKAKFEAEEAQDVFREPSKNPQVLEAVE